MTSHILDPIRGIVRLLRPAPAKPDLLMAFIDGMDVPPHLVGKHFDVVAPDGRVVASTRPQPSPHIASMIG